MLNFEPLNMASLVLQFVCMQKVIIEKKEDGITVITINRPSVKNCVDRETADLLANAFTDFDRDSNACVAVLHGAGGTFCAGADLKAISSVCCVALL